MHVSYGLSKIQDSKVHAHEQSDWNDDVSCELAHDPTACIGRADGSPGKHMSKQ